MSGLLTSPAADADERRAAEPGPTSTGPAPAQVWRAARGPVLVAALLVVVAAGVAVLNAPASTAPLDPRSTQPDGTHALVALLEDQGIDVAATADPAEAASQPAATTVVVTFPERLTADRLEALAASPADLVLVGAHASSLSALPVPVRATGTVPAGRLADPGCALPAARRAGAAEVGGQLMVPALGGPALPSGAPGGPGCYRHDGSAGGAALLTFVAGDRRIVLLGDATPLTNGHLAREGNAALATGLLGARPRLVWLTPPVPASAGGNASPGSLVPDSVRWAVVQLAVAVVVLALWRARRLGRVVVEPLPVVVRASEAVEGRGRLYRRTRARARAASSLRAAAGARLTTALGLPPGTTERDPLALTAAVAGRTGRPGADVRAILLDPSVAPDGTIPADDAALVRLATRLDTLEEEVRRT